MMKISLMTMKKKGVFGRVFIKCERGAKAPLFLCIDKYRVLIYTYIKLSLKKE